MTTKIFFPGLNGIRAIAAFAVILSHINLGLSHFGLEKKEGLSLAGFGVTIFFSLSGFLITYLLLAEKDKTSKIAIQKFYMRRILRIWPLYFLYLLLVVFIMGLSNETSTIWYYVFVVANIPFSVHAVGGAIATIPLLAHYWSLAVEEQFYAFWPWIVKRVTRLKLIFIVFILGFTVLKFVLKFLKAPLEIQAFLHYTRFGCLAIGGLGAYFYYFERERIQFLCSRVTEVVAWAVLFVVCIGKFHIASIIDHEIIALVTLVLIYNQASGSPLLSLENKLFDYLGKISFGLYVYNPLIIYLMSFVLVKLNILHPTLNLIVIYSAVIFVIVSVSHISYNYFEKPFLKIKAKYTTVRSAASKVEAED